MTKCPLIYLGIAVLFAIVVVILESPNTQRVDDSSSQELIPNFDTANVHEILIEQLIDGVRIKRDGDRWLVSEHPTKLKEDIAKQDGKEPPQPIWHNADSLRIKSALGTFAGLEKGIVVSDNIEKQKSYQLDVTGLKLKLTDKNGKTMVELIIGKNGPDFTSTYIKLTSENQAYLIRRTLVGAFSPREEDWREKKLWIIEPDMILLAEFSSTKHPDKNWFIQKDDITKNLAFIKKIASITASGFGSELGDEEARLSISYADEKKVTVVMGKQAKDGTYPARLEGLDDVYMVSSELVDTIKKGPGIE